MIVLLEAVNYGWIHEEVNAGMLQLVNQCSNDDIVYVGEKKQVETVSKLYKEKRVSFATYSQLLDNKEKDLYKSTFYYLKLINSCIKKYSAKQIFILYGNPPCILAVLLATLMHPGVSFRICIHGAVERIIQQIKDYERLFKLTQCTGKIKIITFSPFCTDEYWKIKNKIVFLHHPFIPAVIRNSLNDKRKDKVVIGVIGACANPKTKKIISDINKMEIDGEYEFWIASRFAKHFERMDHVKVIDLSFERSEMEEQIQKMDCILLPYDKNEYKISASGVLWDAVSNQVPCIMLNSPYFCYYEEYVRGTTTQSREELIQSLHDFISKLDSEKYEGSNIEELREYNKNKMRELLA